MNTRNKSLVSTTMEGSVPIQTRVAERPKPHYSQDEI